MRAHRLTRPRPLWAPGAIFVAVVVVIAGWLVMRAELAKRELAAFREDVPTVELQLRSGDFAGAAATSNRMALSARRSKALTNDVVWRSVGRVPGLGNSVQTVRAVTSTADAIGSSALPSLVESAAQLARPGPPASINLEGLHAALPRVRHAATTIDESRRRLAAARSRLVIPAVERARLDLFVALSELQEKLATAQDALEVAPELLGEHKPQAYFLGFQTLAEVRATGGLIGAFGILTADRGRLQISRLGTTARDLHSPLVPVVDLGPDFSRRYGAFAAAGFWSNLNVSPHFPYTDQIARALWKSQTGQELAGTVAVDSVAVSHLLRAVGSITLRSGEVVNADNIVTVSVRDAYVKYDPSEQDTFSLELADAVASRMLTSLSSQLVPTLRAMARAAMEGHVKVGVANRRAQQLLESGVIGGALPGHPGHFLGISLNNAGATKLDYYLSGEVRYSLDRVKREATTEVTIGNEVSLTQLPRVGATTTGGRSPGEPPAPPGRNRLHVSVFGGVGSTLLGGDVNGVPFSQETSLPGAPWILGDTGILLEPGLERGHGVFSTFIEIDAGSTTRLRVRFTQPVVSDHPLVLLPITVRPFTFRQAPPGED